MLVIIKIFRIVVSKFLINVRQRLDFCPSFGVQVSEMGRTKLAAVAVLRMCPPPPKSSSITWELVGNAALQAPF